MYNGVTSDQTCVVQTPRRWISLDHLSGSHDHRALDDLDIDKSPSTLTTQPLSSHQACMTGHRKRRTALANPRVSHLNNLSDLPDNSQQQIARPRGDLNPCLRSDTSQINCTVEQPIDPDTLDDPLSRHLLQDEIVMVDPPGSSSGQHSDTFDSTLFQQPHGGPSNSPWSSLSHSQLAFPHSDPHFSPYTQPHTPPSYSNPSPSYIQFDSSSSAALPHVPSSYSNPPSPYIHPPASSSYVNSQLYTEPPSSSVPQFEQPYPYGTNYTRQLSGRVPPAVQNTGRARAAPYVLPGIRFVPAYAPLRPDEQVRGGVVTAGVFRVSRHV